MRLVCCEIHHVKHKRQVLHNDESMHRRVRVQKLENVKFKWLHTKFAI
jgi:hypothetical protein